MWYDIKPLIDRGKIYNFVVSPRGNGKTFSAKLWAIDEFLNTGKQFIYVRRYREESQISADFFFSDIISSKKYPDVEFSRKGRNFYINNKLAGCSIPLSVAHNFKSASFPNVNKIIFDEFIKSDSGSRYIPNEPVKLFDLYETIARARRVVLVCLGNAISIVNPYFIYFKLQVNPAKEFNLFDKMCVQFFKDQEFIDMKNKTEFGKLIKGTAYGDFCVQNEFLLDNSNFIGTPKNQCNFMFALMYENTCLGFWFDPYACCYYVNEKYDPDSKYIYAADITNHSDDYRLITNVKNNVLISHYIDAFKIGRVKFKNQTIKSWCFDLLASWNIH